MSISNSSTVPSRATMVRHLVLKDWYFQRWSLVGYVVAGALALGIVAAGGGGAFYFGSTLLITVLIAVGVHMPMATIIEERREKTLPFVMSLPVSAREYTTAKVLANLLTFLVPWLTLLASTLLLIAAREALPDGLIPFATVLLLEIFTSTCLIVGVALVSESLSWTIGAVIFGNLFFQGFLYSVSHLPSIAADLEGPTAVWSPTVFALLTGELAAIGLILGMTFFLQARKTDFL